MPNRSPADVIRQVRPPRGQWLALDLTLHNLIILAYPEFRFPKLLVGEPQWVKETRFDLSARMSTNATQAEVTAMVRSLLAQRFGLRTHTEQRTVDVYALTLVKPGKLGPGLTPALTACVVWRMIGGKVPDECDLYRRVGGSGVTISAATITDLIDVMSLRAMFPSRRLQSAIDRPIVDRTGLDGFFQVIGPSPDGPAGGAVTGSFFSLLEEQLGLKLAPARAPADVLVIDSVKMPDPD
jgi:uncharacterized protein (TIGR03435 family)